MAEQIAPAPAPPGPGGISAATDLEQAIAASAAAAREETLFENLDALATRAGAKEMEADNLNFGQDGKPIRVGDIGALYGTSEIFEENVHFQNNQHEVEFSPQISQQFFNISDSGIRMTVRVDFGKDAAHALLSPVEQTPESNPNLAAWGHFQSIRGNRFAHNQDSIAPDVVGLLTRTLRVRKGFPMNLFSKVVITDQDSRQVEVELTSAARVYEHYVLPLETGERPGRVTYADRATHGSFHAMGTTSTNAEERRQQPLQSFLVSEMAETKFGQTIHLQQTPEAGQTFGANTVRGRSIGIYGYIDFDIFLPLKMLHRSMENLGAMYIPPSMKNNYNFTLAGIENFLMMANPPVIPNNPQYGWMFEGHAISWRRFGQWAHGQALANADAEIAALREIFRNLLPNNQIPPNAIGTSNANDAYRTSELETDIDDPRPLVNNWTGSSRRIANGNDEEALIWENTDAGPGGNIEHFDGRWELTAPFPKNIGGNGYLAATADSGTEAMSSTCVDPSNPTAADYLMGIWASIVKMIMNLGQTNGVTPADSIEGNVEVFFLTNQVPQDAVLRARHNFEKDPNDPNRVGVFFIVSTKAFDNQISTTATIAVRGGVTSETLAAQSHDIGFPLIRCEIMKDQGSDKINKDIDFFVEETVLQRGALQSNTMGYAGEQMQPEKVEIGIESVEYVMFHGGLIIGATTTAINAVDGVPFNVNPWGAATSYLLLPLPNFSLVKNRDEKSEPAQFNIPPGFDRLTNTGRVLYWRLAAAKLFTGRGGILGNGDNSTLRHVVRSINFVYNTTTVTEGTPVARIAREEIFWSSPHDPIQRELFTRKVTFDQTRPGEFGVGEERTFMNKQRLVGPTSLRKNYYRGRLLIVLNNNGGLATIAQTPALPGNFQLRINPLSSAVQAPQKFTYRPYIITTRTDVTSFLGGAVGVWSQMGSSVLNPEANFTPRMMEGLGALNPPEN